MGKFKRLQAYVQCIPPVMGLALLSGVVLLAVVQGISLLTDMALASQGRVAVTTGDFLFLFTTWQGWAMLLLGAVAIFLFMALDVNAPVILADRLVRGERARVFGCVGEALRSMRRFLNPAGVLVIAYIAFVVPTVGVGVSLSMTENLRIPTFISNIIDGTPLFRVAYWIVVIAMAIVALMGIFCVHGVVLDGMGARASFWQSVALVRAHWKSLVWDFVRFALAALGVAIVVVLAVAGVELLVANLRAGGPSLEAERMVMVATALIVALLVALLGRLFISLNIIKLTQLYRSCLQGERVDVELRGRHGVLTCSLIACALMALCLLVGRLTAESFDLLYPREVAVKVISHRCGGHEAPENTAIGVDVAGELNAWAVEIDIQRTSDGRYAVNHDDDFKRVTGDARTSSQMTMAEVQELRVKDAFDTGLGEQPVATYEEILEHARDSKVKVLVELKGATADRQMADDAVRIAREMGMFDECIFISLKYDLIDYLETTYPEAETGFLAFGSYGNLAKLNCDYLALEELAVDVDVIDAIHEEGKGVFVWTLNSEEQQLRFLDSDIDAIITDEVVQANEVIAQLEARSDLERVTDQLIFG